MFRWLQSSHRRIGGFASRFEVAAGFLFRMEIVGVIFVRTASMGEFA
jgi:hypothetical protein